jgi:hypothetical protein
MAAKSIPEFARSNDISRSSVYLEIASGRLIAPKIGARTIITAEDELAWLRSLPRMVAALAPSDETEDRIPA